MSMSTPTSTPAPSAIRAVIFDLDGLLIDSEPHWRAAEMEVFGAAGLHLTDADCVTTTGLRIDEVTAYWHARRPWTSSDTPAELAARITDRLISRIQRYGVAKEGVDHAITFARAQGVRVGLASSSSRRIIAAAVARLGVADRFDAVHSAEDLRYGKPHPEVYLDIAELLGVPPTTCLAIEDSLNGLIAAKAARMRCVAVPEAEHAADPRFALADAVLDSLHEFGPALWAFLAREA